MAGRDDIVVVLDIGITLVLGTDDDLTRMMHVRSCDRTDLPRHGSREQEEVTLLGHLSEDGL